MSEFVSGRRPIINDVNSPERFGKNFSGPTCIINPGFLDSRLYKKYILFFAHHTGRFIRVATTNDLNLPWVFPDLPLLEIHDSRGFYDHVASPEIYIEIRNKVLYLFFHSREIGKRSQRTFLAKTNNGIDFSEVNLKSFLPFYFRLTSHENEFLAVTKGGNIFKQSKFNPNEEWKFVGNFDNPTSTFSVHEYFNKAGDIRHPQLISYKGYLLAFYTRIGGCPESVYCKIAQRKSVEFQESTRELLILKPELEFENRQMEPKCSKPGPSNEFEVAIRDPYIFFDGEKSYLFYTYGGEAGIAMAEINLEDVLNDLC